ncbi:hypothetical protein [Reinekea sp.]|jgi:hypothetical protein|uniref:hypothetical protein n=1 Tax=Reinekea sp. TaxID=1970455 RepID=UPI002A7F5E83|nr:hypothetical protein [Reinekea sp.]
MNRSAVPILLGLLTLSACSSQPVDTEVTRCVFADSPRTPAPAFMCDPNITGFPVTVLLASEPSSDSVSARIEQTLSNQISLWAMDWSQAWYTSEVGQQAAHAFLMSVLSDEARVVRSRTSPKGFLWLLVGLPMTVANLQSMTLDAVPLTQL